MSAEHDWQFVDTNVLVYAYDLTAGAKRERASWLIAQLWRNRNGCISVQVLQEFYTVARRRQIGGDIGELNTLVEDLTSWQVHSPSPPDVLAAIRIHQRHQVSFWDAMILHSAAQLGCKTVWSEDLSSGQVYGYVRVLNPFQKDAP